MPLLKRWVAEMTDDPTLFETQYDQQLGSHEFKPHAFTGKRATSIAAATVILPRTGTQRRKVYDFIVSRGTFGATDDEMMDELSMSGNSLHPRRLELVQAKLIDDSGQRRKTKSGSDAIVWTANETF